MLGGGGGGRVAAAGTYRLERVCRFVTPPILGLSRHALKALPEFCRPPRTTLPQRFAEKFRLHTKSGGGGQEYNYARMPTRIGILMIALIFTRTCIFKFEYSKNSVFEYIQIRMFEGYVHSKSFEISQKLTIIRVFDGCHSKVGIRRL